MVDLRSLLNRSIDPAWRPWARAWSMLTGLVFGGLCLLLLADRLAPPQDLSWKALRIDDPVGWATRGKIRRLEHDPQACEALLRQAGVSFTATADRDDGGFCVVEDAVRLRAGTTPTLPGGLEMRCPLAVGYVIWDRQVLQPEARARFSSPVAAVDSFGTYACRRMYHRAAGAPSEHARADALDVSGFRLKDGRRISVLKDWNAPDDFVRRVRDGACRVFGTTLSPDFNAAHHDHLHLDQGRWPTCR